MAFPNYAVTDDFDRTDVDPIDGNWTIGKFRSVDQNLKIVSNQVAHSTGATSQGTRLYNVSFVRPFETWVECPNAASDVWIDYCVQEPAGASVVDGYRWQTNGAVLQLWRVRNNAFTKIGGDYAIDLVSGDALGVYFDYLGLHNLYHRTSGVWSLVATVTDTTFISGYIGIGMGANASVRLDNFSAVQEAYTLDAFPSAGTVVTDDFNRANVDPINSAWDTPTITSPNQSLEINGNEVAHSTGAGSSGAAWWIAEQFTPPFEVVVKIGANGSNIGLDYCISDPGVVASVDCYRWQTNTFTFTGRLLELYRIDDSTSFTLLTDSHGIEAKDGDLLGVRLVGTDHYLFYKPVDGEWQLADTNADTTYTSGYVGIVVGGDATSRLDDFRVAELVTAAEKQSYYIARRRMVTR